MDVENCILSDQLDIPTLEDHMLVLKGTDCQSNSHHNAIFLYFFLTAVLLLL